MLEDTFNQTSDITERTRKNVFVINDVDLIIPPTAIAVQKEDLTYSWKALRTKTTTKIPSGHGQIGVTVSCIFTHEQLLDLHRLLVQFRNSPYVYIENRYLRETICPQWNLTQNMAFVVNGVDVSPVAGTSNCFSMSLSLTWFNYFPYGNNFLFREDYLTDWIDYSGATSPEAGFNQAMLSIGWTWEDGKQRHRPSLIYTRTSNGESKNRYDGTVEGAPRVKAKTVNELEKLHLGEEWDLLPLPDNMIPARFVLRPSDSSVYTRYINLLQRDALLNNFAIDVEDTLGPASKAFFHAVPNSENSKVMKTYGLHNGGAIPNRDMQAAWFSASAAWIREMMSHHGAVTFRFQTYCSLDIPASLTDRSNEAKKSVVDQVLADNTVQEKTIIEDGYKFLKRIDHSTGNTMDFQPIRDGLANPNGIVPFLGTDNGPMSWDEILTKVTSRVKIRSPKTNKSLYKNGANAFSASKDRIHYGVDFGVPHGTIIYALRDGIVTYIADENSGSALRWFSFNMTTQKSKYLNHSSWTDWSESIKNIYDDVEEFSLNIKKVDSKMFPIGTFVQSLTDKNIYYYVGFGAGGRYLQLSHSSPSGVNDISNYMHLFEILVKPGQTVKAGEAIAISGNSADFSKSYLNDKLNSIGGDGFSTIDFKNNPNATYLVSQKISEVQDDVTSETNSPYSLGNHLHFEYWEDVNYAAPPTMEKDDKHPSKHSAKGGSRICTDIIKSIEIRDNPPGDKSALRVSRVDELAAETLIVEKIDQLRESGKLSAQQEEDITAMQQIFLSMIDDGWVYYDANSKISNVWFKTFAMTVSRSLTTGLSPEIIDYHGGDSAIVTGMSGGFRNIVPTVPILGHEYPTSQFLGSTEPIYNLEVSLLDQKGSLDGVSEAGAMLEGMRALLQSNARKFREVEDSWCMATDSFMTRLFGSYKFDDYQVETAMVPGQAEGISATEATTHIKLLKRTLFSRADNGTVEGHPGLSYMNMVLEETNPYIQEEIQSTAQSLPNAEESRKQILNAIRDFDFNILDFDSSKLTLAFFLNTTGLEYTDPSSDTFGTLQINEQGYLVDAETKNLLGGRVILNPSDFGTTFGEQGLVFPPNPEVKHILSEAGVQIDESPAYSGFFVPSSEIEDFFDPELVSLVDTDETYNKTRAVYDVEAKEYVQETRKAGFVNLDLTNLITNDEYTALLDSDYTQLIEYYNVINTVIDSANRMIAESDSLIQKGSYTSNSLDFGFVSDALYNLNGVNPSKWRSWQAFMTTFCTDVSFIGRGIYSIITHNQSRANSQLVQNPNWLFWNDQMDERDYNQIKNISVEIGFQAWWLGIHTTETFVNGLVEANVEWWKKSGTFLSSVALHHAEFSKSLSQYSPLDTSSLLGTAATDIYYERVKSINDNLQINGLDYTIETRIDQSVNEVVQLYMRNQPMASVSFRDLVKNYVDDSVLGAYLETFGEASGSNPFLNVHSELYECLRSSGNWGFSPSGPPAFLFVDPPEGADRQILFEEQDRFVTGLTSGPEFFMGKPQKVNRPFVWPVKEDHEKSIVLYHKNILTDLADTVRNDPETLRLLGLEHLGLFAQRTVITGGDAYPDLSLPFHPYFADKKSMSPDFYMWNVYEDGGALRPEVLETIYGAVNQVIDKSYESMVELQTGKLYNPATDPYTNEQVSIQRKMTFQAEGTDNNHNRQDNDDPLKVGGPMASPFYPTDESKQYEDMFDNAVKNKGSSSLSADQIKFLSGSEKNKPMPFNMSFTEGPLGAGGGVQYPTRMSNDEYNNLKNEISDTQRMFGASNGSLEENISPDTKARLKGTGADYVDQFAHMFDRSSLQKLARDSSKDMLSHKLSMKRAYPTFKLFFVEEDDFENRLLSFDDFHSYNGVVDFSVVQSRKNPADHAMITLQNVGGSLDGTRRNAIADLDYITDPDVIGREDDAVNRNTSSEQPFSAIVLRPGLNVQLRAGYSNDPDNLHVLINGRIIDVSWNDNGDLVKIMVQSFGTELAAITKGSPYGRGSGQKFNSTHKLLSTLMLSPEVAHFGRWEVGQLFMEGESKDARLDFTDYSRQGWMGTFKDATGLMTWLIDHPLIMFGLAGVGTALNFLPTTKVTGLASKSFIGKYMASIVPGAKLLAGARPFQVGRARSVVTSALRATNAVDDLPVDTAGTLFKHLPLAKQRAILDTIKPYLDDTFNVLVESGVARSSVRVARKDSARIVRDVISNADSTVDDVIRALSSARQHMNRKAVASQWLPIPMTIAGKAGSFSRPGIWEGMKFLAANGSDIVINRKMQALGVAGSVFGNTSRLLVDAALVGAAFAVLKETALTPAYNKFVEPAKNFFTRATVSLMLSPQDDNLFPPHPKDYMVIKELGPLQAISKYLIYTGLTIVASDYEIADDVSRLISGESSFFEKRIPVDDAEYEILGSTIWDIFHEMSLRHPGWVYGARPYGNTFRYTMFFGVPSQRYWAKPASNTFIARSNKLYKYLADGNISEQEYLALYGDELGGGTIEEARNLYRKEFKANYNHLVTDGYSGSMNITDLFDSPEIDQNLIEDAVNEEIALQMTGRAMQEYLRSLNHRFVPFRRYHSLSSERDIVWNGIMNSENAMANAVEIPYFLSKDANNPTAAPYGTARFKAHWSVPDYLTRSVLMPAYPNCKGYAMAMRYGMGALMYQMKEMYRGEIILTGNPRIRPWDICILMDNYNDMVGPVEVEQVVHTFSFSTGYITEIKPSAVVIGNEISSYPILTGAKIFALAVEDAMANAESIEYRAVSSLLGTYDARQISEVLYGVDHRMTEDKELNAAYLESKYQEYFPEGATMDDVFGNLNSEQQQFLQEQLDSTLSLIGPGIALYGAATAIATGYIGSKVGPKIFPKWTAADGAVRAAAYTTGSGILGGLAAESLVKAVTPKNSLAFLLGGPVMFLQCLRDDAVMLLPLMKNGTPIVSGFNYNDPSMIFNDIAGQLKSYAGDIFDGADGLLTLYSKYGTHSWNKISDVWNDGVNLTGE